MAFARQPIEDWYHLNYRIFVNERITFISEASEN